MMITDYLNNYSYELKIDFAEKHLNHQGKILCAYL
ncbi:hypothetical protein OKW21_003028 [Catalinimonas alkaloidigena]|nr:hypothetical protein [Catalinimonas alkaloidigena]